LAQIFQHGAHVTSWCDPTGHELLFLSKKARGQLSAQVPCLTRPFHRRSSRLQRQFEAAYRCAGLNSATLALWGSTALRETWYVVTSILVALFPLTRLLARTPLQEWQLVASGAESEHGPFVELALCDSEQTRQVWPHSFTLSLRTSLSDTGLLRQDMRVLNAGDTPLSFTTALHTYFRCNARRSRVLGLHDTEYLDSLQGRQLFMEEAEEVPFKSEVDRIYLSIGPHALMLSDEHSYRTFAVMPIRLPDAVVWNPWIAKAQAMADFGDDEYKSMVPTSRLYAWSGSLTRNHAGVHRGCRHPTAHSTKSGRELARGADAERGYFPREGMRRSAEAGEGQRVMRTSWW